jgi:outer membrane immunogenic protein
MKRIVFAAVALSMVAAVAPLNSADAADMAVKAPTTFGPAPIPLWDGLYIGANIGDARSSTSWCTDATVLTGCGGGAPTDQVSMKASGLVAGGQVGYRLMFGNFMIGPEAMLDGLQIHSTVADTAILPGFPGRNRTTTFSGIQSVTANAGFAFDRFLAYGKGGWALTHVSFDAVDTAAGGFDLKGNEYVQGWTAGGGLEYTLPAGGWSIGVEYDYYRFNPGNMINLTNSGGVGIACGFCNFGGQTNVQTILARLNLRIGGTTIPH